MALIIGGGVAWAGGDGHEQKHDPQSHLDRLTKKLDLTQEQQDKILPILQDKHKKMDSLRLQMKALRNEAMAQVEVQLTPEQQEKFQEAREKRKEKMKEYRKKHGKGETQCKEKHGKEDHHE
jgi:Spy/CpxP family protein refolding chaperone